MVQLVFMRLPQFPEVFSVNIKQLKIRPGSMEQTRTKRKPRNMFRNKTKSTSISTDKVDAEDTSTVSKPAQRTNNLSAANSTGNIVDMQGSISQFQPQHTETESSSTISSENTKENIANAEAASSENDGNCKSNTKEVIDLV